MHYINYLYLVLHEVRTDYIYLNETLQRNFLTVLGNGYPRSGQIRIEWFRLAVCKISKKQIPMRIVRTYQKKFFKEKGGSPG